MNCNHRLPGPNRKTLVTRRNFVAAIGALALYPTDARAAKMVEREVLDADRERAWDGYFAAPAGTPSPGILIWPDSGGLSPAYRDLTRRLAKSGYAVLCTNRTYPRPEPVREREPDLAINFAKLRQVGEAIVRQQHIIHYTTALTAQPEAAPKRKFAAVGFGTGSLSALDCAKFDECGALAAFYPDGWVTEGENSPHLAFPKIKAQALIGFPGIGDDADHEAIATLRTVTASAQLPVEIAIYTGALVGWMMPASITYNRKQTKLAWKHLRALLKRTL